TLNGNLIGSRQESQFAYVLRNEGVINVGRRLDFFGRGWRSCFSQLGFVTYKFRRNLKLGETDPKLEEVIKEHHELELSGLPYELTPSGLRMIEAKTIREQQECMLRALLAYEIRSAIESKNGDQPFKPFVFILQVLKKL